MKIVIQRVKRAQVSIAQQLHSSIEQGLLLLVGVGPEDSQEDMDYAVRKIMNSACLMWNGKKIIRPKSI